MEDILTTVGPLLSTLSETSTRDRPVKRRAMEALRKEVKTCPAPAELLSRVIDWFITCTEKKCSEGNLPSTVIDTLLKAIKKRLVKESTEEIRVTWMDVCVTLLDLIPDAKISVTESELMMDVMQIGGEDPFSEVIQRGAKLIILYPQRQPKSTDYACERMVRLTIPLLIHKHTAVRVLGIKAAESVLMASPKGLHLLFEFEETLNRQPIIPALVYDASALVRDTLFTVLGKLLCQWSPRERYQYGDRLLPIILAGTFDELPSIQTTCKSSLSRVGQSCTTDLLEADIIQTIPDDAETTGLKHLVHICFDTSLVYLLSTDFITVRQVTGLDSLRLFIEYAQTDDLVKHIKKIIGHLTVVFLNNDNDLIHTKVYDIITLLARELPSHDIYLDVLLSKLDYKYLATERNGFPGTMTVLAVMSFLAKLLENNTTDAQLKRVQIAIEKPYLKEYIVDPKTLLSFEHVKSIVSKIK
ncbi:unnamed protein product [Mucor hiemalis]